LFSTRIPTTLVLRFLVLQRAGEVLETPILLGGEEAKSGVDEGVLAVVNQICLLLELLEEDDASC
jgi:hypothetical protein